MTRAHSAPNQPIRMFLAATMVSLLVWLGQTSNGQEPTSSPTTEAPAAESPTAESPIDSGFVDSLPSQLKPDDFDSKDIAAANTVVESLHVADWLGPLAPVALSPFFGIACLSGLAIWGPDWLSDNALLASAGPLKNQFVFAVFAALTLMTSLPRLTKVSKPIAQAMDQLESYSVIVILVVIKLLAGVGEETEVAPVAVIQFGFLSFTAETLLALAMVVNLFVINSVKFFFEVLIWLTPIPAVDAMFEVTNKAVCAALMALYAFSPTIATVINLVMLLAALIVFRWIHRRLTFYRSMLVDLFLSRIWKAYGKPTGPSLIAFVKHGPDPFTAKSRWRLTREGEAWHARHLGLLGTETKVIDVCDPPRLECGWVMHSLTLQVSGEAPIVLHVSRRFDADLEAWSAMCGFEIGTEAKKSGVDVDLARAEFT